MQVDHDRLYRVKVVAGHFDVSISTIYRAIECGQLDALKLGTGKGALRVPGAAVLAYEQACIQAAHEALATSGGRKPTAMECGEAGQTGAEIGNPHHVLEEQR
ncbi:MAG: helix-turn-helix transcriptional regulator [Pseudonocardiaceae bacterium]